MQTLTAQEIANILKEKGRTPQREMERVKRKIARLRRQIPKKDLLADKLKVANKVNEEQKYLRLLRVYVFDVEDILAGRVPG